MPWIAGIGVAAAVTVIMKYVTGLSWAFVPLLGLPAGVLTGTLVYAHRKKLKFKRRRMDIWLAFHTIVMATALLGPDEFGLRFGADFGLSMLILLTGVTCMYLGALQEALPEVRKLSEP